MTTRSSISMGSLVYTEELGWIDKGHANGEGALSLFLNIQREGKGTVWESYKDYFCIEYYQDMSKSILNSGFTTFWLIRKGLSENEKKSIALSILMYVSLQFELHQSSFPQSLATDSGFSCEDLVSNLLGFYTKIERKNYTHLMKAYPKEYAFEIWDYYGRTRWQF